MKRAWFLVGLVMSHVVLGLLVAAIVAGTKTRERFRACTIAPMCRMGMHLSGASNSKDFTDTTFAQDLEKLSHKVPEPSTAVFQLMKNLTDSKHTEARLADAQKSCASLGWHRCDHEDLLEMRKMLLP